VREHFGTTSTGGDLVRLWLRVIVALVGLTWLGSVFFTVSVAEYAIVLRFGSQVRVVTTPGLGIKLPFPLDRVVRFDRRLLVFDLPAPDEPARELLTRDKKNIEVQSYACWRVQDPLRFLQTVGGRDGAESYLRDIVASELGQQLGRHDLAALISVNPADLRLAEIGGAVRDACGMAAARECGVEIVDFRVKRISLPEQNRESVFERMRAERKQIATRYRSEGEQRASAIRADADRQRMEILSEARREALEIQGQAEGEAARVYNQAYSKNREFYEFLRTLSSYEKTMTERTTILLPPGMEYLRLFTDPRLAGSPAGGSPAQKPAPAAGEPTKADPARAPAAADSGGKP
jgi:modulator of FtsH protease HflC